MSAETKRGWDDTVDCQERLRDLICQSPSIFGRLVAVSRLQDQQDGSYRYALADNFGPTAVDRALRRLHRDTFSDWLNLNLAQQELDLSIWLSGLGHSQEESASLLQSMAVRLSGLIPRQHFVAERDLFVSDFEVVLILCSQS